MSKYLMNFMVILSASITNQVLCVSCHYYPYYPSKVQSSTINGCDYCCYESNPNTSSKVCCYFTNNTYWWISLIVLIPCLISCAIGIFYGVLKKINNKPIHPLICSNNVSVIYNPEPETKINTPGRTSNSNAAQYCRTSIYEKLVKNNPIIQLNKINEDEPLPVLPASLNI